MSGTIIRHTPPPWNWARGEAANIWRLQPAILVCTSGGPGGDRVDQCNAVLIQHAPDILAELRELAKEAREHLGTLLASDRDHSAYFEQAINRAERLIAKVEGRT